MRFSILSTMIALLIIPTASAQNVLNGTFESWVEHQIENIPFQEPTGWTTTNDISVMTGAPFMVVQSSDYHAGSSAMELRCVEVPDGQGGNAVMGGMAVSGYRKGQNTTTGIQFGQKPARLDGYYKYAPMGTDTASITVILTRWNASSGKEEVIGEGYAQLTAASSLKFSSFSVPINYKSSATPDSCTVIIACSGDNPTNGTWLRVDDLSFAGSSSSVSSPSVTESPNVVVSPNPFTSVTNIRLPDSGLNLPGCTVIFTDITGRVVKRGLSDIINGIARISAEGLADGFYLVRITDRGTALAGTRVLVQGNGQR